MSDKDKKTDSNPTKPTVAFDFIKTSNFRSIRADGAIGGLTPTGNSIHMALYSERNAIPRRIIHELNEDGSLGDVREEHSRHSVVREMEVDVFMDIETAQSLKEWLEKQLEIHEKEFSE